MRSSSLGDDIDVSDGWNAVSTGGGGHSANGVSPDKRFICTLFVRNAIVLISLHADSRINQQTRWTGVHENGRSVYIYIYIRVVQTW